MPTNAPDKIPPGPELDALTAQRVFGWKNVHKHDGALVGKLGTGEQPRCRITPLIQLTPTL